MTRHTPGALAAAVLAITSQSAQAWTELGSLAQLGDRIEISYQRRDLAGIEAARLELLTSGSDRAAYYAAFARLRQGLAAGDDRRAARDYVDDCIEELRDFVDRHPDDGEARALLGSCYGISTRYHRLGLASRGLEARRQMAAARELAPHNPWVILQDGLADDATPRVFGGNRQRAVDKLKRAAALFDSAVREGSRAAVWGAAETRLQLMRMQGSIP
jgi:hypothetical protein